MLPEFLAVMHVSAGRTIHVSVVFQVLHFAVVSCWQHEAGLCLVFHTLTGSRGKAMWQPRSSTFDAAYQLVDFCSYCSAKSMLDC